MEDENKPPEEENLAENKEAHSENKDEEKSPEIIKTHPDETIILRVIEQEMKKSYLEYSM